MTLFLGRKQTRGVRELAWGSIPVQSVWLHDVMPYLVDIDMCCPPFWFSKTNWRFHLRTAQAHCWGTGWKSVPVLPKTSGNGDEKSECTALITHAFSPETLSRWTQYRSPSLVLPTSCFSSEHVKCAYSSSCRDPSVAECLLKAGSNQSPKYQRLNFLFLTTLDQKMRQLSEQLSPPMNLQFSFDSEEPMGTVRLSTLQDVVLNWVDTHKVRLSVQYQTAVQNIKKSGCKIR